MEEIKTPRYIRCYDNGGKSFDQYTVVFTKKAIGRQFMYLGMSEHPTWANGFGQHGWSNDRPIDFPYGGHLGKHIKFTELPIDCQKLVLASYEELWEKATSSNLYLK
jgi:hypothetical protein